jgi:hypothetical protein
MTVCLPSCPHTSHRYAKAVVVGVLPVVVVVGASAGFLPRVPLLDLLRWCFFSRVAVHRPGSSIPPQQWHLLSLTCLDTLPATQHASARERPLLPPRMSLRTCPSGSSLCCRIAAVQKRCERQTKAGARLTKLAPLARALGRRRSIWMRHAAKTPGGRFRLRSARRPAEP